jgi:hypothetical protein
VNAIADRVMVLRCAHAMGYRIETVRRSPPPPRTGGDCAVRVSQGKKAPFWFNPLYNKEQAFNMLLNFGLSVTPEGDSWCVFDNDAAPALGREASNPDLQRAIVECVMGFIAVEKT